uniref:SAM-dependent MTase TRM10-type domain-containing protein n=1 Tax=Panagrolaimus davidi TaxID=227884 RepID=A0A914PDG2_9BILA
MDRAQEQSSINVVKRYKFTPIYLPIRKYIKWEAGAFNMPLPNILRALKVVAETGGDWEKAVNENVAYRHKVSIEEQRERLQHRYDEKFQAKQEKQELIKMIEDTMNKRD